MTPLVLTRRGRVVVGILLATFFVLAYGFAGAADMQEAMR